MVMALSNIVLISSHVSSWTKPTWLASMKHGSHIMLQRLVRSMVSTEPRPWVTVEVPWLCSFSSLWARMSRPGKLSSRCLKKAGSIDITSSKWPCLGQNFMRQLAIQDLLANLRHALGAERIGGAGPAERGLFLLPTLEQRLFAPFG